MTERRNAMTLRIDVVTKRLFRQELEKAQEELEALIEDKKCPCDKQ